MLPLPALGSVGAAARLISGDAARLPHEPIGLARGQLAVGDAAGDALLLVRLALVDPGLGRRGGNCRKAVAMRFQSRVPSSSSMDESPSSSARLARMNCSMRGWVRGTMTARLSKLRISQNVL